MNLTSVKIILSLMLGMVSSVAFAAESFVIDRLDISKVCYKPGEIARLNTYVTYTGTVPQMQVEVTVKVYSELDRVESVSSTTTTLAPNVPYLVHPVWLVPAGRKWGHEFRVSVRSISGTVSPAYGSGFFAVGEQPWQVGHWAGVCNAGQLKTSQEIDSRLIELYRRWHYTAVDYFSWQPSCWETMAPAEDEWHSGQTSFLETKFVIKELIRLAHNEGVQVYSYIISWSWGPAGVEWMRTHPEWWNFDRFGRPFPKECQFDINVLDKMRNNEIVPLPWCCWSTGVIWNDDMKAYLFDQMKQSVAMFGWDGFRSDGLPTPGNVYDRNGNYHEYAPGNANDSEISWIEEVRQWLKDNISQDCQLHFNAGSVSFGLEKQDPNLFKAKAKDSYCLWEGAYMAALPGTSLNNMKTFASYLHDEVGAAREVGGYRHVGWMGNLPELLEATATACGAQVDYNIGWDSNPSPATWGPSLWRSFTFRYSRYFWGPDIHHIADTNSLFNVVADTNVWWDSLAQERVESDSTRCIVLHLINLPAGYPANQDPPTEKVNIPVTLKLGQDRTVKAFALSPTNGDPGFSRELTVVKNGVNYEVIVPRLQVWTAVVFKVSP